MKKLLIFVVVIVFASWWLASIVPGILIFLIWGFFILKEFERENKIVVREQLWIAARWLNGLLLMVILILTFYVNWYLPHGPRIYTGDYECPDYGPCYETYVEDLRNTNIPVWAKFLRRESNSFGLIVGLGILSLLLSKQKEIGQYKDG
ncbi:MAG: hypothetical protein WD883_00555 [Candidatus Colwellbacteria bacterium]